MILDRLKAPVVLAPLGGGPSTPELTAAVVESGGFGFLPAGYLSAEQTAASISATRALTGRAFGVNLFVPGLAAASPAVYSAYAARVRGWAEARGFDVGEPLYSDDDWGQKLELLLHDPVPVVSFAFGCPSHETRQLQAAGSEIWVTITTPEEARLAAQAGADVLIAQGAEAGGHRGSFLDGPDLQLHGLMALLQIVCEAVDLPVVASGGIATGNGVAAVLAAGARAAQIGTAFMLCPEAGTAEAHRAAIASERPTALTRAFTGRLARGIRNDFMDRHPDAPVAYPEIHYLTAPIRKQARVEGDAEAINLWAGEAHALARAVPAGDVVKRLLEETSRALSLAATDFAQHESDIRVSRASCGETLADG